MSDLRLIVVVGIVLFAGCSSEPATPKADPYANSGYYPVAEDEIKFLDDPTANATVENDITTLEFTNQSGETVSLKEYLGKKPLVLVITRGYSGSICPYCATQTSRLIANYSKFRERDAEVVVVYPLEKPADQKNLEIFVAKAVAHLPADEQAVPFPLLLDVELKAVDALGIRKSLSKPATYIFDKEGQIQFAYVGNSLSDRPSVKAILAQLDRLKK